MPEIVRKDKTTDRGSLVELSRTNGQFSLKINGTEIQEVNRIDIRIPIDGLANVGIGVNFSPDSTFVLDSNVTVEFRPFPGYIVTQKILKDGSVEYSSSLFVDHND